MKHVMGALSGFKPSYALKPIEGSKRKKNIFPQVLTIKTN